MLIRLSLLVSTTLALYVFTECEAGAQIKSQAGDKATVEAGPSEKLVLPKPFATPSVRNRSKVIG